MWCTLAPLANTIELSISGGDAVLCQIILTTCLILIVQFKLQAVTTLRFMCSLNISQLIVLVPKFYENPSITFGVSLSCMTDKS